MNPTIDILKAHKSIRKFTAKPISFDILRTIVTAGQAAASSRFLQAVTIIQVTDIDKRNHLAKVTGNQAQVTAAPEFLVFCADLSRPTRSCEAHGGTPKKGFTEQFIIATVDAALYAQNVVIAAESLGLGICYIGALRNNPEQTSELLCLPENVYPVFGLCIGYPAEDPEVKPRLPISVILKENVYDMSKEANQIQAYDASMKSYYSTRSDNQKLQTWSEQMTNILKKDARPHMRSFLAKQGFEMK